jgi:hypothetical protein
VQTTNSQPWGGQLPYLTGSNTGTQFGAPGEAGGPATSIAGLLPSANALYGNPANWPQYFPSSTYAPLSGEQSNIINSITQQGWGGGDTSLQTANGMLGGLLGPGGMAMTTPAFGAASDYITSAAQGNQGVNQTAPTYGANLNYLNNQINGQGVAQTQGVYNSGLGYLGNQINGQGVAQTQPAYNTGLGYINSAEAGNQGVNQTAPVYGQGLGYLGNQIAGQGVGQTQGAFNTTQGYLQNMIGGANLNPFTAPGFQNVINGTLANVIPAVSASFINGGRSDSGLAQAATTAAATNAIGSLANQNYLQEQGLQQGAAGIASQNQQAQQQLQAQAEAQAQNAMLAQQGIQQGAVGLGQSAQNTQLQMQANAQAQAQAAQNQQLQLQANAAAQGQNAMLAQQGFQQGAAGLGSNNYLTQQGNQIKGAAVAPYIDQAQMSDMQSALNAQGLAQNNQQNLINAAVQNWNYNQTLPYNMLGMYQGFTGGNYGGSGSVSTPYYQNQGSNIMGGLLGGLGIASSLFSPAGGGGLLSGLIGSDRRMKTDIVQIGQTRSGFPLYRFRYLLDHPTIRRIGVMAQDLLATRPEAVVETPIGYLVDYAKALA